MKPSKNQYIRSIVSTFVHGRFSRPTEEAAMKWLAKDDDRDLKDEALSETWDEVLTEELTAEEEKQSHRAFLDWKASRLGADFVSRRALRIWQAVAAVLFIALGAGMCLALLSTPEHPRMIHAFAPTNATDTLALPDGTRVILNSGSTLLYPERFEGSSRDLYLTGEACFEVAKDKYRPFTVHTDDFHVTALGTRFNVNANPSAQVFTASLMEGSVKVTFNHGSSQFVLSPDEELAYDRLTGRAALSRRPSDDMVAWQRGELVFTGQTLRQILSTLKQRYPDINFSYNPSSLPNDRYSFRFTPQTSLDEMMRVIADVAGGIEVRTTAESVTVTRRSTALPTPGKPDRQSRTTAANKPGPQPQDS